MTIKQEIKGNKNLIVLHQYTEINRKYKKQVLSIYPHLQVHHYKVVCQFRDLLGFSKLGLQC